MPSDHYVPYCLLQHFAYAAAAPRQAKAWLYRVEHPKAPVLTRLDKMMFQNNWDTLRQQAGGQEYDFLKRARSKMETHWPALVKRLIMRTTTPADEVMISEAISILALCNPNMMRIYKEHIRSRTPFTLPSALTQFASLMDDQALKYTAFSEVGLMTKKMMSHEWTLLRNTDPAVMPFVIGDVPVCPVIDKNWVLLFMLPITPEYCLIIHQERPGLVCRTGVPIKMARRPVVENLNAAQIIFCERHIISNKNSPGIRSEIDSLKEDRALFRFP